MSATQWIGAALLVALFAGFFAVTATIDGVKVAAAVWAGSAAVTAVIVVAVYLVTGEWS